MVEKLIIVMVKEVLEATLNVDMWFFIRGNCTSNQNLACFVRSLKIINTLKTKIMLFASWSKLSAEKLKNGINILISQVVLELWPNMRKIVSINDSKTAWRTKILSVFFFSYQGDT